MSEIAELLQGADWDDPTRPIDWDDAERVIDDALDKDLIEFRSEGLKRSCLHLACVRQAPLRILAKLIDRGIPVNVRDGNSCTLLCLMSSLAPFNICRLLLERGADATIPDCNSTTPLHNAATDRSFSGPWCCQLLLIYGADVNAKGPLGRTPLHKAADRGCLKTCEVLVEAGAEVDALDDNLSTPLMVLARLYSTSDYNELECERYECARYLIARGADVSLADCKGWTSLHQTTHHRSAALLTELLLQNGAQVNVKDIYGMTPVDYVRSGDSWLNELLETVPIVQCLVSVRAISRCYRERPWWLPIDLWRMLRSFLA